MELKDEILNEMKMVLSSFVRYEELSFLELKLYKILEPYNLIPIKNEIIEVNQSDNAKILGIFLISKKVQGCTDRTIKIYRNEIKKFLIDTNKPLKDITANDIRYYIAKMKTSKTTQNNTLRCIKTFYTWCTAEEYIDKNISLKVSKIKQDTKVKIPFTEKEVEMMREEADNLRMKALIEVMLSTACRVTEISRMNIEDIKGDEMIVLGKGNKERTVYLNAKAKYAIDNYLNSRDDDNPALFVSLDLPHSRLQASGIEIITRKLGRKLGIKAYPHKFRRTAATLALNRGMQIEQVQQMLGHNDPATTLIYAKTASENLKYSHKKFVI